MGVTRRKRSDSGCQSCLHLRLILYVDTFVARLLKVSFDNDNSVETDL